MSQQPERPDAAAQFKKKAPVWLEQQEGDDADRMSVACGCVLALVFFVTGAGIGFFLREILRSIL